MWFKPLFDSARPASRHSKHQGDPQVGLSPWRRKARRLLLEGLEDRSLMAFNPFAEITLGDSPQDLLLADLNGDDRPDMVVPSWSGTVAVRLGNADGTFGSPQSFSTGAGPHSVAAGDLTGDGKVDLVTANSENLSLLAGDGSGGFGAPENISLPPQTAPGNPDTTPLFQSPRSVATGDINGDGELDLVALGDTYWYHCPWYCYGYTNGYVNVLLGNGVDGVGAPAAEAAHLGTNLYPSSVAVGDVNGDTKDDVVVANNGYWSNGLSVLLNVADEPNELALGGPQLSGSGFALRSISLGDVDGDTKVDTLLRSGSGLSVQKGNGDGTFTSQPAVYPGINTHSAVMGDVNDDGELDLVAAGSTDFYTCTSWGWYGCYGGFNTTTRQASVVLGNGAGSFSLPLTSSFGTYEGYSWLPDVAVANLTGDGMLELVTVDYYSGTAIVAANDGDWDPPPSISISDAVVVEGNSGTVDAVFTVTIVGDHTGVTVDFATANYTAVAGEDYTITAGTLDFDEGQFVKTISVPVIGEKIDEDFEYFFVNLSNPIGGQFVDSSGFGTIEDDDTDPVFSISDAGTIAEDGSLSAKFVVTLDGEHEGGVTVEYTTSNGSAAAGSDYTAQTATLTFGPGETTKDIFVPILHDTMDEYDEEFYVYLFNANKAKISSDSYGYGTILDDDAAPLITIDNVSRNEGNNRHTTPFNFTVRLSAPSGKYVSVNFDTTDGTARDTDDYFAALGTVNFQPGDTTETLTVTVRGDKTKEPNETFFVDLSGAVDATISDPQGMGTIVNDDGGKGGGKPSSSLAVALLLDDTVSTARRRK